jgi:ketosteroid isomerase-like protein
VGTWRQHRRSVVTRGLALLSLIGLAGCSVGAPAQTPTPSAASTIAASPAPTGPDLAAILRQHYDASSKGDAAAAARFFTDDATMIRGETCPPQNPCKGTAEIEHELMTEIGNKAQYTLVSADVSGSDVRGRLELRSVTVTQQDLDRLLVNLSVTFNGDKISKMTQEYDASDAQSAVFVKFQAVAGVTQGRNTSINRGDLAGTMAFYADDAVLVGLGLCAPTPCTGKAAVQKEIERQIADKLNHTTATPATARFSGGILSGGRNELRSNSIKAAGVDRILIWQTSEVKNGKIVSQRQEPDMGDAQTVTYVNAQRLPPEWIRSLQVRSVAYRSIVSINTGDVNGMVSLFTDSPDRVVLGSCTPADPCREKAQIQNAVTGAVGSKTRFTILATDVSGDTVVQRVELRSDQIKAAGIDRVIATLTIQVAGTNKISSWSYELDRSDPQTASFANK